MSRMRDTLLILSILLPLDAGMAWYCKTNCEFWQLAYPPMDHRTRSEIYHHGLAPNRAIIESRGPIRYRYATNSLGFKDAAPREVALKSDRPRVLFIGDSFTEGVAIGFAQTFVGLIAERLGRQGVEVLNSGVDSYAPIIYRSRIEHLIETVRLRFDHVVVFLDISDIYDQVIRYQTDSRGRLIVPVKAPESLSRRVGHILRDNLASARLFTLVRDHLAYTKTRIKQKLRIAEDQGKSFFEVSELDTWLDTVTGRKEGAWTYDQEHWQRYGRRGRQLAALDMDALRALLQGRGIGLTLVVYPWPDQLFHDPEADRHQAFWRRWAAERQVPFISLFPNFTQGAPRAVLERYFIPGDLHWNIEGHQLVARVFLDAFTFPPP